VTPAQQSPLTSIRARLRRKPAAPTTIVSPPLPAPLPESDFRRAERLTGPRSRHPWSAASGDPWAQAPDAQAPDAQVPKAQVPEALATEAQEQQPVAPEPDAPAADTSPAGSATAAAPGSRTPAIHGVLAPRVTRSLHGSLEVRPVAPGAPPPPHRPAAGRGDLLVVERAALFEGVWAGTETARGTGLLHELLARIEDARAHGATTVLVESPHHPNVGTNLVRDAVQVIVAADGHLTGDHRGLSTSHRAALDAVVRAAHPQTPEDVREPG
jgi:hypothetical protein